MKFIKADKPITTTHKTLGEIVVDSPEVPQVESVDEAVQFCGGPDGFLSFFNGAVETNAKNGGRAALRTAPEGSVIEDLIAKVRDLVRKYTPEAGAERGPSKAAKAKAFDSLAEAIRSGKQLSREELEAMLLGAR